MYIYITCIHENAVFKNLPGAKAILKKYRREPKTYSEGGIGATPKHAEIHYNTLHHAATRCNTLQHATAHCNTQCNTLQHAATHCNTLHHTATHCNTLQHNAATYTKSALSVEIFFPRDELRRWLAQYR